MNRITIPQKWGFAANFLIRNPVDINYTLHRINFTAIGNYTGMSLKVRTTNDTCNNFHYIGKSINDNRIGKKISALTEIE